MSIALTPEIRQQLSEHPGEPVELVDDLSHARYVLLPAEQFELVRAQLSDDGFSLADTYAAQEESLAKGGWGDEQLDAYNDYDAHRK